MVRFTSASPSTATPAGDLTKPNGVSDNGVDSDKETESDLEEELKNILAETAVADESTVSEADLDLPSVPAESPRAARLPKSAVPLLAE